MEETHPDFITVINSLLLLMDYQTNLIEQVDSGDKTEIKNAVIACAKASSILKVPIIITTLNGEENGEIISEISDIFPGKDIIKRQSDCSDALMDPRILNLIRKNGREKIDNCRFIYKQELH